MSPSSFTPPYPASWFDRYLAWVDRLPIPVWLYYLLLYLTAVSLIHLPAWLSAATPFGQFDIEFLVGGFWPVFESGTVHYLDHVGRQQMQKFRPLIKSRTTFDDLLYRIQTMPARTVFVLTALLAAVIILLAFLSPAAISPQSDSPLIVAISAFVFFISYVTSPIYLYHIFHQLGVVREAFSRSAEINLFKLGSLHSLSTITARTGNALFLLLALNFVQNVLLVEGAAVLFGALAGGLFVTIAILVFILPLRDVHARIQAKKEKALELNGDIIQKTIDELHSRLTKLNYKKTEEIDYALSGLLKVRDEIKKISPWPWQPETLRTFLSAILLPIFLIIVQQVFSRLL